MIRSGTSVYWCAHGELLQSFARLLLMSIVSVCAVTVGCTCDGPSRKVLTVDETGPPSHYTGQCVVRNEAGRITASFELQKGVMHGECKFWSKEGRLISSGIFKKGRPWEGTFLGWGFVYDQDSPLWKARQELTPDFPSFWAATYDSESPRLEDAMSYYKEGKRVSRQEWLQR